MGSKGPARLIVTCRTSSYFDGLRLGELPCVTVQELTEEQIQKFSRRYLRHSSSAFLDHILPRTTQERDDPRSLYRLTKNPYMLSALTYMYEYSPQGSLPTNMGVLFRKLTRALWKRETMRHSVGRASFQDMEIGLARLALAQIEEDLPISVPVSYAESKIGSRDMLYYAAGASFLLLAEGVAFYHQLLQEYFAAVAMIDNSTSTILSRLERPEYRGTIRERIAFRWDQVMVALCGLREDRDTLVRAINEFDRELAAICIMGCPEISDSARREFILSLLADLKSGNGWLRFVAARTLRQFPNPIAVPGLTEALNDHWGDPKYDVVSDYANEALRRIATPEALDAVAKAPRW